jgi:hypothetical protein
MDFKSWYYEFFVPGTTTLANPHNYLNLNMGVRSKYVGPDDTGELGGQKINTADFGEKRPKDTKKRKRLGSLRKQQKRGI